MVLGKLPFIIGAGVVGSILAKDVRIPGVSDLFSGALRIAFRPSKREDGGLAASNSHNDSLLAQVNSLRQELQLMASGSGGPVMIVTGTSASGSRVVLVVVVAAAGAGCACMWWKGWKLPDFMFATRRGLADASNAIAKQLESVYSSLSAARRHLSSRMDTMDANLKESTEASNRTKDEVSELRGDVALFRGDVQSVHYAVRTLETKISRIQDKQDYATDGVGRLCDFVWTLESGGPPAECIEPLHCDSSGAPESSTASNEIVLISAPLPSARTLDSSPKLCRPVRSTPPSGLKDLDGKMCDGRVGMSVLLGRTRTS